MKQKIMLASSLLLLFLLFAGTASAGLNTYVQAENYSQVITENTSVSNNTAVWVPLVNFTLNNTDPVTSYTLDELEFRVLDEGSPVARTDLSEIGIFIQDSDEPNSTVTNSINIESATTTISAINVNLLNNSQVSFTLKMKVSDSWSDNKNTDDPDAVGIEITKYILENDDPSYVLETNSPGSYYWYADTTGPVVNISCNATGPFKAGEVVNITAVFDEPVDSPTISLSGAVSYSNVTSKFNDSCWYYEYSIPAGKNGAVDVSITSCKDSAGNLIVTNEKTDAFVIDTTAPTINVITPENGAFINNNSIDFNFTIDDNLDEDINYTFYIDDNLNLSNGNLTAGASKEFLLNLSDGKHSLTINATDDAGNLNSTNQEFVVDTGKPTINIIAPEGGYVFNGTGLFEYYVAFNDSVSFENKDELFLNITLNLSYTNASTSIDGNKSFSEAYWIDGTPDQEWKYNGSLSVVNLQSYLSQFGVPYGDGTYTWTLTVTDETGNSNTSEPRKLYIDTASPVVELVYPSNDEYTPTNGTFKFIVNDSNSGLPFDYKLFIDGGEYINGTLNVSEDGHIYNVSVTDLSNSHHTWYVNITDKADRHVSSSTVNFTVDNVSPTAVGNLTVVDAIGYTSLEGIHNCARLYANWTASNDTVELADPAYSIYISPNSTSKGQFAGCTNGTDWYICGLNLSLVYGKDYWVTVVTSDRAGNNNTSTVGPVQTYEDMNVTLEKGWNLKSVPKTPLDASAEAVFGEDSTVIYWDGYENSWDIILSDEEIETCKGYWVYYDGSSDEFLNNIKFKPDSVSASDPDAPASLELAKGWQMIGQTSTDATPYYLTLTSLEDYSLDENLTLDSINSFKYSQIQTYVPGEGWGGVIPGNNYFKVKMHESPLTALTSEGCMVPGQGYWIFMKENGEYASIEGIVFARY
jgi:hypothetical protein